MPNVSPPPALRKSDPLPLSEKSVWSLRDAAQATTLSIRTLRKLIADGTIPARRIGRRVLLDPNAVKAAVLATSGNTPA